MWSPAWYRDIPHQDTKVMTPRASTPTKPMTLASFEAHCIVDQRNAVLGY